MYLYAFLFFVSICSTYFYAKQFNIKFKDMSMNFIISSYLLFMRRFDLKLENMMIKLKIFNPPKSQWQIKYELELEREEIEAFICESIHLVMKNGDIDKIESMLHKLIDMTGEYNPIKIMEKFITNEYIFTTLLKYIDIDTQDDDGRTLLIYLIGMLRYRDNDFHGEYNKEIENKILYILEFTKNINLVDNEYCNALFHYVDSLCHLHFGDGFDSESDIELGESNIELDESDIKLDENKTKILKKILELGADIYYKHLLENVTILHVIGHRINILKCILDNAYVDGIKGVRNIDISVLFYIFHNINYSYDTIELLLQYIDINQVDSDGFNIRDHVITCGDISPEIIELLIESGARL